MVKSRLMTPVMAYKNSNPGAPMPKSMTSNPMDESKAHEMKKGDVKADKKETKPVSKKKTGKKVC